MRSLPKIALQCTIFVLPWVIRRRALNFLFNWNIHRTGRIGLSVILARRVSIGPRARVGHLNYVGQIDELRLDEDAGIGNRNYVVGFSTSNKSHHNVERTCSLHLKRSSGVTSRHYVDCTYGVFIGEFSTVAGIRTVILSHSIDVRLNIQSGSPIVLGRYNFVGTNCVFLPGAVTGDYQVISAASAVRGNLPNEPGLFGGNPAEKIKDYVVSDILYFSRRSGNVT